MNIIKNYFDRAEINLSSTELAKFETLYTLLVKYNKDWDLSRLTKEEDIIVKHFIDSVLPAKLVKMPKSLVDIGTGPGFPGIPIKIVSPQTKMILAEPRFRRVDFMNMVIKELELSDIEVYPHLVTDESFFDVEGVITRAFEIAGGTLDRVKSFLPKGGQVILLKGPGATNDISALTNEHLEDYELQKNIEYTLPIVNHERRILIFKKLTDFKRITYKIMMNEKSNFGLAVSSSENKRYKDIKKSAEKGPKKSGITLIAGKKIIIEAINKNFSNATLILPDEYSETDKHFLDVIEKFHNDKKLFIFKKSLFSEIEVAKIPILAIDTPTIEKWDGTLFEGCSVVIPFQDPANVGSAIRSAAAFGIKNVIMLSEGANPYSQKAIRAASGTVFAVNIFSGPSFDDIADICEEKNIPLVSLDKSGCDIRNFKFPKDFFILAGIEGKGLSQSMREHSISIPIANSVESLNAYAALSIALYQYKLAPQAFS